MSTTIDDLLKDSLKEVERRKDALLKENEELENTLKQKEIEADKRIAFKEQESLDKINAEFKILESKRNEVIEIQKSILGYEERLSAIKICLENVDSERKKLVEEQELFEDYKTLTQQKFSEIEKSFELREISLKEAETKSAEEVEKFLEFLSSKKESILATEKELESARVALDAREASLKDREKALNTPIETVNG